MIYRVIASVVLAVLLFLAAAEAVIYTLNTIVPLEHRHNVTWIKL